MGANQITSGRTKDHPENVLKMKRLHCTLLLNLCPSIILVLLFSNRISSAQPKYWLWCCQDFFKRVNTVCGGFKLLIGSYWCYVFRFIYVVCNFFQVYASQYLHDPNPFLCYTVTSFYSNSELIGTQPKLGLTVTLELVRVTHRYCYSTYKFENETCYDFGFNLEKFQLQVYWEIEMEMNSTAALPCRY